MNAPVLEQQADHQVVPKATSFIGITGDLNIKNERFDEDVIARVVFPTGRKAQ
jgi:hypothetical protein